MNANGPKRAFSRPSRPRRNRSRAAAPTPPAITNPAPNAPAATAGSRPRSLAPTSVASPSPVRRCSTASASCSRSDAISRRTSATERLLVVAIALQRLRGQTSFCYGLLGNRRRAFLDRAQPDEAEDERDQDERSENDQERRPDGQHERDRGRAGGEAEAECIEEEDRRSDDE